MLSWNRYYLEQKCTGHELFRFLNHFLFNFFPKHFLTSTNNRYSPDERRNACSLQSKHSYSYPISIQIWIRQQIFIKIFWDTAPCSPLKVNRYVIGTCVIHLQGRGISKKRHYNEPDNMKSQVYSSRRCYSETSTILQRTTMQYILENRFFHKHRSEKAKSYKVLVNLSKPKLWWR